MGTGGTDESYSEFAGVGEQRMSTMHCSGLRVKVLCSY